MAEGSSDRWYSCYLSSLSPVTVPSVPGLHVHWGYVYIYVCGGVESREPGSRERESGKVFITLSTFPLPQEFCSHCSLYLQCLSPRYPPGLFPHFLQALHQISSSHKGLHWQPYIKLQYCTWTLCPFFLLPGSNQLSTHCINYLGSASPI